MTHSLIIEEVLAHPQDISWLPWAVQYFFLLALPPAPHCLPVIFTGGKRRRNRRKSGITDCHYLCDYRTAGADGGSAPDRPRLAFLCGRRPGRGCHGSVVPAAVYRISRSVVLAQQIKRLFNKSYNVTKWLALASALCAVGLLIYTGREVSVVLAR